MIQSILVAQLNTPQPRRKTICLVMIVRNEAAVIRRCLESAKAFIDYWIVCDTGSTDDTGRIIQKTLAGIPGALHKAQWIDFGHNRTIALNLARGKADYCLLIDADMTINAPGDFRTALTEDAYLVRYTGPMDYWVERLVSDQHEWEYVGPAHEYMRSPTAKTRAKLAGVTVTHHGDESRQRGKIEGYLRLLKQDLESDPNNSRHIFYIAESYRDLGNFPQAIEWYEKPASMGGWDEEVWYSLYQVARLQHRLGMAWPLVLDAYLRAYEFRPTRIEPIYQIARFYRVNGQYHLAYMFSRAVIDAPYPEDLLFIERSIYQHELPQEYALCCEQLGKRVEAVQASERMLACAHAPDPVSSTAGLVQ